MPNFCPVMENAVSYTHLDVYKRQGDYSTGSTFEEFAREAEGISRIGVLRADVDNLGQAIVSGFRNSKNGDRYMTLSRTATLSLSLIHI